MGGGKSRALCEDVLEDSLNYPGLRTLVCRQSHTSIVETTKKTMMDQVLPPELILAKKESMGEDWVRLRNQSVIHFVGLDDPVRWFSSEIGKLVFDEAHEISEDTVVKLATRLRQKEMPCRVTIGFNPENPGHWLYKWLILGAVETWWPDDYPDFHDPRSETPVRYAGQKKGTYKPELFTTGGAAPLGDCEFFFARASDNVHLERSYVEQNLAGLPPLLRQRYLEGKWLYVSGKSFFDIESLESYRQEIEAAGPPLIIGRTTGSLSDPKDKIRVIRDRIGPLMVWKPPVRESFDEASEKTLPAHRYIVAVDVSSGTANDYSAVQVIDIEEFEQVAELQAMIDPDLLALEAFRLAAVYNGAVIVPEITGGWGFTIATEIERLFKLWKGPAGSKPRLYTRKVLDRLSKQWTDRLGWDTTTKTRAMMLDTLERVLRERELRLYSDRLLAELGSFVWPMPKDQSGPFKGVPQAQPGMNDDLVMSLAIAVAVTLERPRVVRKVKQKRREPQFAATGY